MNGDVLNWLVTGVLVLVCMILWYVNANMEDDDK